MDLDNTWNYSYVAVVYLGTPPQPIKALFDTGSANAWIVGKESIETRTTGKSWTHDDQFNYFDIEKTTSVEVPPDYTINSVVITFGSGKLQGYFVKDHCMLGDVEDPENQLKINMFQFGYVTKQTVFTGGFDAIIGLAYPAMAEPGVEPFFDAMMREKIL